MANEYIIQPGDTFYNLAKKWGGTWEEWVKANPGVNPNFLHVGQKVNFPQSAKQGINRYASFKNNESKGFEGDNLDEIQLEVDGIQVSIRRVGERQIPHELHFLIPRVEIRKIEPIAGGPCEVQIMMSNLNIIHSPRVMSGEGNPTVQISKFKENDAQNSTAFVRENIKDNRDYLE